MIHTRREGDLIHPGLTFQWYKGPAVHHRRGTRIRSWYWYFAVWQPIKLWWRK